MKDTLIIIPAFNEEKGIRQVLERLKSLDDQADVFVVNDGSKDDTYRILKEEQSGFFVTHPINLGYGAALQTAYKYAVKKGYRYVAQFDADGQHDPEDLRRLIAELRKDEADVVIGSRVLGDPGFSPGFRKRMALFWFRSMIRLLIRRKITDPTSGLKGFNRDVFQYLADSQTFPMDFPDADMIIHMHFMGFDIREIPIRSHERKEGTSMHAGLYRQFVYMLKVTLSILVICVHHLVAKRRRTL